MDLLTRIYETYAVKSDAYWLANDKRFREAYTPTNPIKVVWHQIDDVVAYVDAGSTPYLPKQVVYNAFKLVLNTGIFAVDCRECNKRLADDKTLPHLKVFFVAAHREWRLLIQNETGTPYGAAHNTIANPDDGCLQKETVDAIANLEIATANNCASITQLTATVTILATELATVNTKLVIAFQTNHAIRCGRGGRDRTTCGRGERTGAGADTGTGSGATERTGVSAPNMAEAKYMELPIH